MPDEGVILSNTVFSKSTPQQELLNLCTISFLTSFLSIGK